MSKKPISEAEGRRNLIGWARYYGTEEDQLKLFARVDDLMKHAKSEEEKTAIAAWGIQEIDRFWHGKAELFLVATPPDEFLRSKK
jgi:hypothetical protein